MTLLLNQMTSSSSLFCLSYLQVVKLQSRHGESDALYIGWVEVLGSHRDQHLPGLLRWQPGIMAPVHLTQAQRCSKWVIAAQEHSLELVKGLRLSGLGRGLSWS